LPWRGTLLKGISGGPVHLNHVPLGVVKATAVVDGPLDRHTLIDDALVRRAHPPTKKSSRARSSRIPADLPIDAMDARRRILIRGMLDN
jgi:hypothetical protein